MPLNTFLVLNSFILIGLILTQNENTKEVAGTQNSSNLTNPFEKITWISFFFQFSFLLIKIKSTDF
jgi:preprotein translocase subunit SecG